MRCGMKTRKSGGSFKISPIQKMKKTTRGRSKSKSRSRSRSRSQTRRQNASSRPRNPNYLGKKHEVDYLVNRLTDNQMRENASVSFDTINKALSPAERIRWANLNLQESDVVWEDVDESIIHCGRAVFLVCKKGTKLHLMIFPMCCVNNWKKLKDENGKKNEGEDAKGRYDIFSEGDCMQNGYMIHPKTYRIIKVF